MAQNPLLQSLGAFGLIEEVTPGAAVAITATEVIAPIEGSVRPEDPMLEVNTLRNRHGKGLPVKGGEVRKVSFAYSAKSQGTAGSGPPTPIQDAYEASGLTRTNHAGVMDLYNLTTSLLSAKSVTAKEFHGSAGMGKTFSAKGCRFNLKIAMPSGKFTQLNFDGSGARAAEADEVCLAAGAEPASTVEPPITLNSGMFLAEYHAVLEEVLDGASIELREGAALAVQIAKSITQGGTAQKIYAVAVPLKKVGTPANSTLGVWMELQTDNAGNPSGTPVTGGTSSPIAISKISAIAGPWYLFMFADYPTHPAGALCHYVVKGDYDPDPDNNIEVATDVVAAPAQNSKKFDAAWVEIALRNLSMRIYVATGEADLMFGDTEIDLGNELVPREDPNATEGTREFLLVDRLPKLTLAPEEQLTANRTFRAYRDNQTPLFFHARSGAVEGNIFEVSLHNVVIVSDANLGDRGKRLTHPLILQFDEQKTNTGLEIRYT